MCIRDRPIFEDTKRLLHLEGEWFISIREFLHSITATIKIDGVWTPQLEREHDRCLMDIFANDITTTELVRTNRCRIYLQATTIADITDAEVQKSMTTHGAPPLQPSNNQLTHDNPSMNGHVNQDRARNHGKHGDAH